jgi:hypothetical protein
LDKYRPRLKYVVAVETGVMDVECGGKRSATPLWLRVALLLHQRVTAVRESGVALRLPPHSIATLSMAVSRNSRAGGRGSEILESTKHGPAAWRTKMSALLC